MCAADSGVHWLRESSGFDSPKMLYPAIFCIMAEQLNVSMSAHVVLFTCCYRAQRIVRRCTNSVCKLIKFVLIETFRLTCDI